MNTFLDPQYKKLLEDNRNLRDRAVCKVCLEDEICMVCILNYNVLKIFYNCYIKYRYLSSKLFVCDTLKSKSEYESN